MVRAKSDYIRLCTNLKRTQGVSTRFKTFHTSEQLSYRSLGKLWLSLSYNWIDKVKKIDTFQKFWNWIDYMINSIAPVLLIYPRVIIWAIAMFFWCFEFGQIHRRRLQYTETFLNPHVKSKPSGDIEKLLSSQVKQKWKGGD